MAAEIMENDSVLLRNTGAWHGLGMVVEKDLPPVKALEMAGLDWTVSKSDSVIGKFGDSEVTCNDFRLLRRDDTNEIFASVNDTYSVLQNRQVAEMAESLAKCDTCPITETIGSIRNGRKCWLLMVGNTVEIGGDESKPYLSLIWGHDGLTGLSIRPTATRIVCSNTLHMVLNERTQNKFTWKHSQHMLLRADEIKKIIANWHKGIDAIRSEADAMAAKPINREKLQAIWTGAYELVWGEIPLASDNESKHSVNRRDRALSALKGFAEVFDKEIGSGCKPNLWTAANAVANYAEHRERDITDQMEIACSRLVGTRSIEVGKVYSAVRSMAAIELV